MRQQADVRLYWSMRSLAADPRRSPKLRLYAAFGAREFSRRWLARGLSGRRPRPSARIPIYGRYGGPGHSGPGRPVDALDALFQRHDAEYETADLLDVIDLL